MAFNQEGNELGIALLPIKPLSTSVVPLYVPVTRLPNDDYPKH